MFTYIDVIQRAIEIINRGNPPYTWSDHGDCCPWCAISTAKTELDEENNTGISISVALSQLLTGQFDEVDSDEPLVFARKALAKWNEIDLYSIDKIKAVEILTQAKSVIVLNVEQVKQ